MRNKTTRKNKDAKKRTKGALRRAWRYDDDCATLSGVGEKLLRLLQRKELENLLLLVSEQDQGLQAAEKRRLLPIELLI